MRRVVVILYCVSKLVPIATLLENGSWSHSTPLSVRSESRLHTQSLVRRPSVPRVSLSPVDDTFDPFVRLGRSKVDEDHTEHNSPLPLERSNLEHLVVDDWNVDDGEGRKHEDDGAPKENLVVEQVDLEDTAGKVLALERMNHEDNDERGKAGRSGLVDWVTDVTVLLVTQHTEFSGEVTPKDNNKVDQGQRTHKEPVEDQVNEEFEREDLVECLWRLFHSISGGGLEAQRKGWWTRSERVDPESSDGGEREDGLSIVVLESKTDHQDDDFSQVSGKQVEQEFGQVSENGSTFTNGTANGSKVVVGENHAGRLLGNVGSSTHADTDIGTLEGRSIVDTVTSHDS